MPYLAGFVTPQDYGALANGSNDDTSAINQAITAVASTGGVVYFPPGTYAVTPVSSTTAAIVLNNGTSGYKGVRLIGHSQAATIIKRLSAGPVISMSGPSTDTTAATHCEFCSLEDLTLSGNSLTGTLIQTYYADNLCFRDVRFTGSADVVQDCAEFWDSRYFNVLWDTNGSTTANTTAPNLWLRNSAATSGFGYSADTVNNIYLFGCRWEQYKTGAVRVERGLGTNIGQPYSLYFVSSKLETTNLNGGNTIFVDTTARDIHFKNTHVYVGGFFGGYSTAQDAIVFGPQFGTLKEVLIFNATANATISNGVTVNAPLASSTVFLDNVRGSYTGGATPTGAHVNFGTNTGSVHISDCSADNGTQFGGNTSTAIYAPGSPLTQVAGAVSDGSFGTTPLNGVGGLDTLNNRLYYRVGGTWSFLPIKTVSSAITGSTTISNTAALSTLETVTVPGNDPQTGSVYRVVGYGVYSTTGTPTMTFALYWGGTGGTLIASIPAITAGTLTSAPFYYDAVVNFRSTTVVTAVIRLNLDTSTSTDATSTFVGTPGVGTTVSSSSNSALSVGFTWGTASASNTISCQGGYLEKIR